MIPLKPIVQITSALYLSYLCIKQVTLYSSTNSGPRLEEFLIKQRLQIIQANIQANSQKQSKAKKKKKNNYKSIRTCMQPGLQVGMKMFRHSIHSVIIFYQSLVITQDINKKLVPSFYLSTDDLKIEINTLNSLPYQSEILVPFSAKKLSSFDYFLQILGLKGQTVLAGIPYGQRMLVYGNFVYNPNTSQLRCYKIKEVTAYKDYSTLKSMFAIAEIIKIVLKIGILVWLLKSLHSQYSEYKRRQNNIQIGNQNIDRALISHKKQSMNCSQCQHEIANILFQPCFHLDCCAACSEELHSCPVCNSVITGKVKIFNY